MKAATPLTAGGLLDLTQLAQEAETASRTHVPEKPISESMPGYGKFLAIALACGLASLLSHGLAPSFGGHYFVLTAAIGWCLRSMFETCRVRRAWTRLRRQGYTDLQIATAIAETRTAKRQEREALRTQLRATTPEPTTRLGRLVRKLG
jgi:hypothetical protein